ncbi:MAG: glycosyltransferase family 4 protein [Myxococcales bacterium]|nr:glycosyltransferase family 4 protein [Myxococcales bacterium]
MRIWVFSHYFPPEGNAPASRIHEMARRWVAAGHAVTVITGPPSVPDGVIYAGYRNHFTREVVDGIDVVRVRTYVAANKGFLRRSLNFASYMVSASLRALGLRRPDVIVATTPQFFCGWAGVIAARMRRRPLVLEVRDLWPASIVAVGALREGPALTALEHLERRMYAAAAHIVTVGEGYADELRERGVADERLSVITNGVDLELFAPRAGSAELLAGYGLGGRFVCAYVGTVGMGSGLQVLIPVAERLRERGRDDIGLLVVGDGAIRGELEAAARARGLDNLVFAGRQPKAAIPEHLASAGCCLVHLQRVDLFKTVLPSKIFEAMAMARPIVLGVEGRAAALVEDAGAGICVTPEDPEAIAAALVSLADDRELCARLGAAGRARAEADYDRTRLADRYLELLEDVARR